MDSACPEKDVTEILSDSDHSTKVAPTTLSKLKEYIKERRKVRQRAFPNLIFVLGLSLVTKVSYLSYG